MKATAVLPILLATALQTQAAITSKTLTPSKFFLNEGDEIVITLSISTSYTGPSEGIYSLTANVDWAGTDLPWPAASLSWSGLSGTVITSTASYPTYDDGDILVSCSGSVFEQYQTGEMIISDGTPVPFSTSVEIEIANVAPTLTTTPTDMLIDLDRGYTTSFSAWATDPGFHDVLTYDWDLDGDGFYDDASGTSTGMVDFSGYSPGVYLAKVRVSDDDSGTDIGTFNITVIPEPSVAWISLFAAGVLGWRRRR